MRHRRRLPIQLALLIVLLPVTSTAGSFVVFQRPDPIGKGHVGFGVGTSALFHSEFETGDAWLLEAGGFLDIGIGEGTELRLALSGLTVVDEERFSSDWLLDVGLEFKHNISNDFAMIAGLSAKLFLETSCADDCGDRTFTLFTPFFGTVIGFGDPGGTRFILTPRLSLSLPFPLIQLSLSAGADIPLAGGIALRPELSAGCILPPADGDPIFTIALGTALVF